jgi:hypothetical protein
LQVHDGKTPLVRLKKLSRIPSTNGVIKGVNDQPRRPNSDSFAFRVAAAHARGVWLTDELNAQHGTPIPHGAQIIRSTNAALHRITDSNQRMRQSTYNPNPCDTCDPSGGGGTGASPTTFDDSAGNYAYDTEADFADGTSMLFEEFTDGAGDQVLTSLDSDGTYTEYAYESTFVVTPAPQPTMQICLTQMDGSGVFAIQCGSQNFNPFPKWACPYIGGGIGLATKWATAAATKNAKAGELTGLAVGVSINNWCTSTAWLRRIHQTKFVVATLM